MNTHPTARPGRRRIALPATLVAGALAVSAAVGLSAQAGGPPPAAYKADGPFLSWKVRGDLAHDREAKTEAIAAWDKVSGTSHRAVRVLYAARDADVGRVIVLEGRARHGRLRLAILAGPWQVGHPEQEVRGLLRLHVDRKAPRPAKTRQVSFLWNDIDRVEPGDDPADANVDLGDLVFTLAEPGATIRDYTSKAWDTYSNRTRFADAETRILPDSATRSNTRLTVKRSGSTVYSGRVDSISRFDKGREVR